MHRTGSGDRVGDCGVHCHRASLLVPLIVLNSLALGASFYGLLTIGAIWSRYRIYLMVTRVMCSRILFELFWCVEAKTERV